MSRKRRPLRAKEPNLLIEAKQKMTREELLVWAWCLANARFWITDGDGRELTLEELEEIKKKQEVFYAVSEVELEELRLLFPEHFNKDKIRYWREVLKGMEKKIVFEVNCEAYKQVLEDLGFTYILEKFVKKKDPTYCGIATIMGVFFSEPKGDLQVVYTPLVAPLLVLLKKWFTIYNFEEILNLDLKASIVLYRIFKEKLGLKQQEFKLSKEALIELLDLKKISGKDLRRDYIEPAINEINEKTSLRVSFQPIKRGRGGKIVAFKFFVRELPRLPKVEDFIDEQNLRDMLSLVEVVPEGELKVERTAYELLKKIVNINPAVALWYLLHFPKEKHREVWEEIKKIDVSSEIKYPEKFLESKISQRNENWDFLLSEQMKKLIKDILKNIAKPYEEVLEKERKEKEILLIVKEISKIGASLTEEQRKQIRQKVEEVFNHRGKVGELVKKLLLEKDLENLRRVLNIFRETYTQELDKLLGF